MMSQMDDAAVHATSLTWQRTQTSKAAVMITYETKYFKKKQVIRLLLKE